VSAGRKLVAAAVLTAWSSPSAWAQGPARADDPSGEERNEAAPAPGRKEADRPPARGPSIVLERDRAVRWDPRWRKFETGDYVVTGVGLATAIGSLAIPPEETRWLTRNGFDDAARDAVVLPDLDDRNRARDASDVLLAFATNQVLVDTFIVTWWAHDAGDVAFQMLLMNLEAIAVNSAINGLVSALASRQRPYGFETCVGAANEDLDACRGSVRYRSFYSGHTSTTFAMAGLTCMHHAHLPLYGGGALDAAACATGYTVATLTALMRMVADYHWASDVITGAATGTLSGALLPWLLHYRSGSLPQPPEAGEVLIRLYPTTGGVGLLGIF
jgi:membrane-associated phospholipid phosphatase